MSWHLIDDHNYRYKQSDPHTYTCMYVSIYVCVPVFSSFIPFLCRIDPRVRRSWFVKYSFSSLDPNDHVFLRKIEDWILFEFPRVEIENFPTLRLVATPGSIGQCILPIKLYMDEQIRIHAFPNGISIFHVDSHYPINPSPPL